MSVSIVHMFYGVTVLCLLAGAKFIILFSAMCLLVIFTTRNHRYDRKTGTTHTCTLNRIERMETQILSPGGN